MPISRRRFMISAALSTSTLAMPSFLRAQGKPKVVVIGGGAGGGTAARYLAKDSKGEIDVTLIEPQQAFTTCFFSNLHIGGFRTFDSITHSYKTLESTHGVKVIHQMATAVDRGAKVVTLADGSKVPYDRLIVSPGISLKWESVPGYSPEAAEMMPHAWQAGPQTQLLKSKIEAMKQGGTFVMIAPPNPYRCPPGPYERISMVAHIFKQKNPTAKIIVLDPKEKFSKQALFQEGWQKHYPGMVEWIPASILGSIKSVDAKTGKIETDLDVFNADVANVIPAQAAGAIAAAAGLTNDTGFCPIVPGSMQSQVDENVYVLGDSSIAGDMPKSAFSANSQAKVCANAVRGALTGSRVFPAKFSNTCWSLIATDDGVKVGANYEPAADKITKTTGFISKTGEDSALRKATYEESLGWYAGITEDIFGA
ncbi:MAG: NAD(P)/FAD-dependent oxidoreductase [Alphaproteobacteria bacterium]|nr:NAD(P)/FAD-dependent oxidoreductase [Alphaproteobacteria bacterium]